MTVVAARPRPPRRCARYKANSCHLTLPAPASALPPVRRLADAWLVPATTRVRAAYALARLAPLASLAG
ncbi:MAG TPA: hypothetical protein PLM32_12720, partial [Candidatus Competibacter sp.]|nr:hypothetical protein [Candidatus Competibacter sp.]